MNEENSESGFTLIELMVTTLLLGLVFIVIGGFLMGTLNTQRTVDSLTQTASESQSFATSVDVGVRNASAFTVRGTSTAGDQILIARTANNNATIGWSCRAWYYDADKSTVRYISSASAIANPTETQLLKWTALVSGITPFGANVFTKDGDKLLLAFNADTQHGDVRIDTTIIRSPVPQESSPCFTP